MMHTGVESILHEVQKVIVGKDDVLEKILMTILSGGHVSLVSDVLQGMRAAGIADVPVVVGGIIPPADAEALISAGVARVYTPKDYEIQDGDVAYFRFNV